MVNAVNRECRLSRAAEKEQQEQNDETLHLQLFPQTEVPSCEGSEEVKLLIQP